MHNSKKTFMKKEALQFLTISFTISLLFGCGGAEKTEDEKQKNKTEYAKVKSGKLLDQAKIYIDKKDFIKAKTELQNLLDKYPDSEKAAEAKQLLPIAVKGAAEQHLTNAKAKVERQTAEKEAHANVTKKLRSEFDDIKEITWYYDKGTPKFTNVNNLCLYIGKKKTGEPWLRFRIQFTANNWLFIQSYEIKTDKNSYSIPTSHGQIERDHGSGGIWEWYDVLVDNKLYTMLNDVANSKTVKLRHNGKQYKSDRTLSEKEKQGLQNILEAYLLLGGTSKF
jgi:hypothetical protein